MALDFNIFNTVASKFKDKNRTDVEKAAVLAELQVTEGVWRKKAPYAVALMTAHILEMDGRKGRAGGLSSTSVGSLSKSFGGVTPTDSLDTTSFGIEFKRLRKQIAVSPFVV